MFRQLRPCFTPGNRSLIASTRFRPSRVPIEYREMYAFRLAMPAVNHSPAGPLLLEYSYQP